MKRVTLLVFFIAALLTGCSDKPSQAPEDTSKPPYLGAKSASTTGEFIEIPRSKAGLDTVIKLEALKFDINTKIEKLMDPTADFQDKDYAIGLEKSGDIVIVTDRFKERIVNEITVGVPINTVKQELGIPSVTDGDLICYKTKTFYIAFKGTETVLSAALISHSKSYDDDYLAQVLRGMTITDEEIGVTFKMGQPTELTVWNNFEGKTYSLGTNVDKYKITYVNKDLIAEMLDAAVTDSMVQAQNVLKSKNISPDGTKSFTYADGLLRVTTLDHSKRDLLFETAGSGFRWLTDGYVLYIKSTDKHPYVINILSAPLREKAVFQPAGKPLFGYMIMNVESDKISFYNIDKVYKKVAYSFKIEKGAISFDPIKD